MATGAGAALKPHVSPEEAGGFLLFIYLFFDHFGLTKLLNTAAKFA